MSENELKEKDRVKRKNGGGCYGIVQSVQTEITSSSGDTKDKGKLVSVQWDNGTISYFDPSALELVKE